MSFEDVRLRLLGQLDAVDSPDSALAFQQMLADELRVAETGLDPDAPWHAHLLRLMGDALAGKLLSRHTIRELARDGNRPAALAGQGDGFKFVLDIARRIAGGGVVPLVADLTHLIGVGDVIAVTSNAILIIEGKNRTPPQGWTMRGRHWRQQQRMRSAASYLTFGQTSDGQTGEARVAREVGEPRRHEDALRDCIERARGKALKVAIATLGERDYLVAVWQRELDEAALRDALPQVGHEWRFPVFAGSGTAVDNPSPFIMNPYALPLSADVRLALADCDVLVFRFVDLGLLEFDETTDTGHVAIEVYKKGGRHQVRASLDGTPLELSPRFVEQILWDFRSVADTRSLLVETLNVIRGTGATEHGGVAAASPEVPTMASFVYRDPGGCDEPVLVSQIGELANLGVSIPFEELAEIAAGAGDDELRIRGALTRREDNWVLELDNIDGHRIAVVDSHPGHPSASSE